MLSKIGSVPIRYSRNFGEIIFLRHIIFSQLCTMTAFRILCGLSVHRKPTNFCFFLYDGKWFESFLWSWNETIRYYFLNQSTVFWQNSISFLYIFKFSRIRVSDSHQDSLNEQTPVRKIIELIVYAHWNYYVLGSFSYFTLSLQVLIS